MDRLKTQLSVVLHFQLRPVLCVFARYLQALVDWISWRVKLDLKKKNWFEETLPAEGSLTADIAALGQLEVTLGHLTFQFLHKHQLLVDGIYPLQQQLVKAQAQVSNTFINGFCSSFKYQVGFKKLFCKSTIGLPSTLMGSSA